MEAAVTLIVTAFGAFLLMIGIGKADCIGECYGNADGMHCTTCDSPQDRGGWIPLL
jgi:hypothetical protein